MSPAARTQSHSILRPGPLWTFVWRRSVYRAMGIQAVVVAGRGGCGEHTDGGLGGRTDGGGG